MYSSSTAVTSFFLLPALLLLCIYLLSPRRSTTTTTRAKGRREEEVSQEEKRTQETPYVLDTDNVSTNILLSYVWYHITEYIHASKQNTVCSIYTGIQHRYVCVITYSPTEVWIHRYASTQHSYLRLVIHGKLL